MNYYRRIFIINALQSLYCTIVMLSELVRLMVYTRVDHNALNMPMQYNIQQLS